MKKLTILLPIVLLAACSVQKTDLRTQRHTAEVPQATAVICLDQHQYRMNCTMQVVYDSLTVIALQPFPGMEVARIEATPDSVTLIDRMNRRYARVSYGEVVGWTVPAVQYKDIQRAVTGNGTPKEESKRSFSYRAGKHRLDIDITCPEIRYNQPMTVRTVRCDRLEEVSVKTLLPL